MEQNLKQMQELLINEIINKQYNEDDFQSFAFERFPDKDELNKWNYDDLNQLVKEYQKLQQQGINNKDKINQQNQDQNIKEVETRPLSKQSRLIPKKPSQQVFLNVITEEQAKLQGFNQQEMEVLNQIKQERCQIQFDKQVVFSEYEKIYACQYQKKCIEENLQLQFKVITKNNKKIIFSNQVFCIETQPFNWKVERTKEDLQTLEKIMSIFFPEYSGCILQYDQKQDFHLHLENALNIYYNKQKTRSLDYFLLFLNDEMAKELHLQPFSYYTQHEKKIRNFQLNQISTSSGQLKIEFNKLNFQGYQKLKKFQQQVYQNYRKFEIKFQESQQIINLEIEKMKVQLQTLKDNNNDIFIQDQFTQKIPGFNFDLFYDHISTAIQISNNSKNFISSTIEQISEQLEKSFKFLEQPLEKCYKNEQELRNIYINDFLPTRKKFLNDKDVQQQLTLYGLNNESISDYQYETISSIIRDVLPLKVHVNYDVLQKQKDQFAYLITQVLFEAQKYLSKLFKDINCICKNNFDQLTQNINISLETKQKN
ncbi:unnamed protein product [Paramecium pentaurelia]|uniref:Uncharacterized protein n=1 Tax=Paramecium pentaurelia TaxID=43138 RepID=A0A8S1SHE2_9CILI|nr:unnamed protein product [Paramecium pentaurelia]